MTTPQANEPNPYQASQNVFAIETEPGGAREKREMIKKFRDQMHALGAFWIIIGGLAAALGMFVVGGSAGSVGQVGGNAQIVMTVMVVFGVIWILLGVLTCVKQMWAVYVGLGL